jgi:hypothetical protein
MRIPTLRMCTISIGIDLIRSGRPPTRFECHEDAALTGDSAGGP